MVTLHNFSNHEQKVRLRVGAERDELLVEVFDGRHGRRHSDGQHRMRLEPYAWRWYRVGAPDNVRDRSDLSVGRHDPPTSRDTGKS
jgi:maltose alpha-D-glucosyltransferase / alpha-amylase